MTNVTMDNNDTPRFCMTPRFGMTSWGYSKITINIILLIVLVELMVEMFDGPYFFDICQLFILALIMVLVIADIVYQAKLIHGLRKNKLEHLTAYCKYTKILWVLVMLSFVLYMLTTVTGILGPIFWSYGSARKMFNVMCAIWIGAILQSAIMLLVIKEIKNLKGEINEVSTSSDGIRIFNFGFTIKIETSRCKEVKEEDNNNTYTENTSEKVKLAP